MQAKSMRPKVYIAAPYTKGDVAINVRTAIEAGSRLWDTGFAPFIPHLTHFWHLVTPKPYQEWLEIDNEWLPVCNAFLRLPGESSGADKEEALAKSLGIPVFYNEMELLKWKLENGI